VTIFKSFEGSGPESADGISALLAGCRGLSDISLFHLYPLSEEVLLAIANGCPQLEMLKLYDCHNISILGWEAMCRQCKGLSEVDLFASKMTLSMLAPIGKHGRLWQYLRLKLPNDITSNSISELFQPGACYSLRDLTVSNVSLPGELMLAVGQSCPLLTSLTILLREHPKPPVSTASESLARGCLHLQLVDIISSDCEPRLVGCFGALAGRALPEDH
jgi:hypothetical protein